MGDETFIELRALVLALQCTELKSRAGARNVNRVLAHVG